MNQNQRDIKQFLDVKKANDASWTTIKTQSFILHKLNDFLKSHPFREVTEQDIFAFLSYKREQGGSPSSLNLYKVVIKGFYRWLYSLPRHQYPKQVMNLNGGSYKRKMPIRPEDIITKEDVAFLVKYCSYYRDEALIVTLYESGCRVSEFVNINIGHLHFDKRGIVLVVSGKTGERRIRLIESVPYLQKWVETHPLKDQKDKPLWCTLVKPHHRVKTTTVFLLLKGLKKKSGFSKPLNPHNFRHSRLTELAKYLSDGKLKVFAGWTASSKMAGVYVHLSGVDLEEDLFKIAGVEVDEGKPKVSPLKVKECERCHTKNPGPAEFCNLCGLPFNKKLLIRDTLETEDLRNEIDTLREELKTSLHDFNKLTKFTIKLAKEIEELKSKH